MKKVIEHILICLLAISIAGCGLATCPESIIMAEGSTIGAGQIAYGFYQVYQMASGTSILQDPSGTYYMLTWSSGSTYYYALWDAVTGHVGGFSANYEEMARVYQSFLMSGYSRIMADNPNLPPALITLLSAWGNVAKELIAIGMNMPMNTLILISPAMLQGPAVPTVEVIDT